LAKHRFQMQPPLLLVCEDTVLYLRGRFRCGVPVLGPESSALLRGRFQAACDCPLHRRALAWKAFSCLGVRVDICRAFRGVLDSWFLEHGFPVWRFHSKLGFHRVGR